MCLGFPARVIATDLDGATVEDRGRIRRASTLVVPDLAPGDWVLVAAGTVLAKLAASEAAAILAELARAEAATATRQ